MVLETASYGKVVIGWRYDRPKKGKGRDRTTCFMRPYVPHGQEPRPLDIARVQITRDSRDQFVKSRARYHSLIKLLNSLPFSPDERIAIYENVALNVDVFVPESLAS
jgi:hypothetical protein